jgi:release factor glutamine methyltransferase
MQVKALLQSSQLDQLDAELILAFLLSKSRENIIANLEQELGKKIVRNFYSLEKKRLKNYPLAYLTGLKEFYGLTFIINKSVLVPRPETEILIDYLLDNIINKNKDLAFNFLDIGTGSGAIILTLANEIKKNNETLFKSSSFFASDISNKALKIAKKNADKLELKDKLIFKKSNLIKSIPDDYLKQKNRHLIITANLPYLNSQELKSEKSISREPKLALFGGKDGLEYYNELFIMMKSKMLSNFTLICEINPHQTELIIKMAKQYFNDEIYKKSIVKDLSQRNRFFVLRREL